MAMLVYLGAFLLAQCAPGCIAQPASTADMDSAHCGKKFRIATHVAPPFINVDVDKCVEPKCPPEAFGDNGGVVYKLMMEHILPQLRTYCKVARLAHVMLQFGRLRDCCT